MKNLLKIFFRFYIEASIHVSLAVCALVYIFLLQHKLPIDFNLLSTVFFGTITGYNFVKYAPVAKLYHRSLARSLKVIQIFSFLSFLALIYFTPHLPLKTLFAIISGGILTFLYAIPVFYKKNIRSISGLKIFVVALSWSIISVALPAIHYSLPIDINLGLNFLQVFVFIIALIIPFDIRDIYYDGKELKTLPQVVGIEKSKILALLLIIVFFILELIQKKLVIIEATSFVVLLTGMLIWKTSSKNPWYYCSFIIESVPIIYGLVLLLFTA